MYQVVALYFMAPKYRLSDGTIAIKGVSRPNSHIRKIKKTVLVCSSISVSYVRIILLQPNEV